MDSNDPQRMTEGQARSGIFGKLPRELFFVKFALWAVVIVFVLLVVLVLWALATHDPSQSPFNSGD